MRTIRLVRSIEQLKAANPDDRFSTAEAALYLGVSPQTLTGFWKHKGLVRGNLSPVSGSRGPFFFQKKSLDELIERLLEVPAETTKQTKKTKEPARRYKHFEIFN